jgi:diguanylate cyclase (GGDEF)-like protein
VSFKRKLVVFFVVLTLLPLAAAFATFGPALERSERENVDIRLRGALRAAAAAYGEEAATASRAAVRLAETPAFQRALAERDEAELTRTLRGRPRVRVQAGRLRAGGSARGAVVGRVPVVPHAGGPRVGTVVAVLPFSAELAERLTRRSGVEPGEQVVVLENGRVVAGPRALLGAALSVTPGRAATLSVASGRYRALAVPVAGRTETAVAALAPDSSIEAGISAGKRRLLLAFAACLLFVALVAYIEGRSIVRTVQELVAAVGAIAGGRLDRRVRVRGRDELAQLGHAFNEMAEELEERLAELETERLRVRQATLRFGQALSATHDDDQLRRTVVETAVDATSAAGGTLHGSDGRLVHCGDRDGRDRLELSLQSRHELFGTLVLVGPRFSRDDIETASLLAGHAGVALENARLHRIVERQALVDDVTGLANRRRAEEALAAELSRAERFESPVALVLADLDDFKAVNDRHGHQAGDVVLRAVADVLAEGVREVDLAARWGGEEFLLLLPETDADGAVAVGERVRGALAEREIPLPTGEKTRVTASFGVASFPPALSRDELVARADEALYRAKRAGKDRVERADAPCAVPRGD